MDSSELLKTVKVLPFEETLHLLVTKVKNTTHDKWPVVEISLVSGSVLRGVPLKIESVRNESWLLLRDERSEDITLIPSRYLASLTISGLSQCSGIWLEPGSWSVDAEGAPGQLQVDRVMNDLNKTYKPTKISLKADTKEDEVRSVVGKLIEGLSAALAEIGRDKVGKQALGEVGKIDLIFKADEALSVSRERANMKIEFGYKGADTDIKRKLQEEIEKVL